MEVLVPDSGKPEKLRDGGTGETGRGEPQPGVVESLFGAVRPGGDYRRSLGLLADMKREYGRVTKSGIMVGLGERVEEVLALFGDLAAAGCERLTIGQYQQPSRITGQSGNTITLTSSNASGTGDRGGHRARERRPPGPQFLSRRGNGAKEVHRT
jgi:hypothetical protein